MKLMNAVMFFLSRNRISRKGWHMILPSKLPGQQLIHLPNKTNKSDILIAQLFSKLILLKNFQQIIYYIKQRDLLK